MGHSGWVRDTPHPEPVPQDSGLVYRGRVLLELCTHLGAPPGRQRDAIAPVDAERAQVGTRGQRGGRCHLLPSGPAGHFWGLSSPQGRLPRCQLGLCGVFYSATMVPGGPEPLRLELGMGSAAAATAQGQPVPDGELGTPPGWHRARGQRHHPCDGPVRQWGKLGVGN